MIYFAINSRKIYVINSYLVHMYTTVQEQIADMAIPLFIFIFRFLIQTYRKLIGWPTSQSAQKYLLVWNINMAALIQRYYVGTSHIGMAVRGCRNIAYPLGIHLTYRNFNKKPIQCALNISHSHFSLYNLLKTPKSSHIRARYGVSFESTNLIEVLSL